MAACTKCGAELGQDAAFCSSCGSPTGAGTSETGGTAGLSLPGIAFNIAGMLCYILWPMACVFFLVVDPYNKDKFVRFHAFQAVFLGLAGFGMAIALLILTSILGLIPVVGWAVSSLAWIVFGLGLLGLVVFLMYKAYKGVEYRIPLIGELAAQQSEKLP
ncbi:MAG TPA: zinc-ribbon domain-containing protein [Terriglobia bacterium]|nr:zinc-ribbon domain-containing protein [Terriglobia bacterium]